MNLKKITLHTLFGGLSVIIADVEHGVMKLDMAMKITRGNKWQYKNGIGGVASDTRRG